MFILYSRGGVESKPMCPSGKGARFKLAWTSVRVGSIPAVGSTPFFLFLFNHFLNYKYDITDTYLENKLKPIFI
jgi:hypothetical protein